MPSMPRFNKKMTKIHNKILGKSESFVDVKSRKEKRIDRQIDYQDTIRER